MAISASRPLPRLAPSTRPSAAVTGRMPELASVAVSSTMARLEYDATVSTVPTKMSRRMSLGRPTSRLRTAADSVSGRVVATISCSASVIRPRPIRTRPTEPGSAVLVRDEHDHADEDQQRREPGQVEREHDRHQAGADVGTEHHRQRGAGRHQALADERCDDQAGGGARLDDAGDAETGEEGAQPVAEALRQHPAEVLAEHAQHAGAHDVRAEDQQRDRRQQVQEMKHFGVGTSGSVRAHARSQRRRRHGTLIVLDGPLLAFNHMVEHRLAGRVRVARVRSP